jgi:hypothetical protein
LVFNREQSATRKKERKERKKRKKEKKKVNRKKREEDEAGHWSDLALVSRDATGAQWRFIYSKTWVRVVTEKS